MPAPEVTGVRHGLYRDHANLLLASRVVVDMTGLTDWTWFALTSPDRLVFDLSPAVFRDGVGHLPVADGLVRAVSGSWPRRCRPRSSRRLSGRRPSPRAPTP